MPQQGLPSGIVVKSCAWTKKRLLSLTLELITCDNLIYLSTVSWITSLTAEIRPLCIPLINLEVKKEKENL